MNKTPEEMAEEYANKYWTEEEECHAAYRGYVTGYCKAVEATKTEMAEVNIVDQVTVTTSAARDEYVFTIRLSRFELARRSHRKVLGFLFLKKKDEFLNEIADLLTAEILEKLKGMTHE